jgi:hypothetical protein
LIENHRAPAVCDVAVDFNTAVDWPGVHDQCIWLKVLRAGFGQTKEGRILSEARKYSFR